MEDRHVTIAVLVLVFSSVSFGIYLISDYYMDQGWPQSFGQACGDTVGDDCAYINSHLNTFALINYDNDISCSMMLDAGKQNGARYKFAWKRFDLEDSTNCTYDSLTMYDGHINTIANMTPFGAFCGGNDPNTTGFPTQRYATIKFQTDGGTGKKGFRLLAIRTVPYPCPSDDFFHCKSENRCIDSRLKCDGTKQCLDETDEDGCSGWEKFIGSMLALGLTGLIGIAGAAITFCLTVGVIICMCTCCKKQCGCLYRGCGRCWGAICDPIKAKMEGSGSGKVGVVGDDGATGAMEAGAKGAAGVGAAGAAGVAAGAAIAGVKGKEKSKKPANVVSEKSEVATARDVVLKDGGEGKQEKKADADEKSPTQTAKDTKTTDTVGATEPKAGLKSTGAPTDTPAPSNKPSISDNAANSAPDTKTTTTGLAQNGGPSAEAKDGGVTKVDTE